MASQGKLIKGAELRAESEAASFATLLNLADDNVRRDVFSLLNPEDSSSGRIQVGMTIVYPGCRTKGHRHPDREEVYFFTRGRGVMEADGEQWEVEAGDTFYVRPGAFHPTFNPHSVPLEFFWITIKIDPRMP